MEVGPHLEQIDPKLFPESPSGALKPLSPRQMAPGVISPDTVSVNEHLIV